MTIAGQEAARRRAKTTGGRFQLRTSGADVKGGSSTSEQGIRDRPVGRWRLVDYSVTGADRDKTDRPLGDHLGPHQLPC
jgi:hypothetical protein